MKNEYCGGGEKVMIGNGRTSHGRKILFGDGRTVPTIKWWEKLSVW